MARLIVSIVCRISIVLLIFFHYHYISSIASTLTDMMFTTFITAILHGLSRYNGCDLVSFPLWKYVILVLIVMVLSNLSVVLSVLRPRSS